MKKVILLAAIAATTFASCKKSEHDCKCRSTYTYAGTTNEIGNTTETYKDVTKKHAKSLCYSSATTDDQGGVMEKTCELD